MSFLPTPVASSGTGQRADRRGVCQVEKCLGIEAARTIIMEQVQYTMQQYGIHIDKRHTMLLVSVGDLEAPVVVASPMVAGRAHVDESAGSPTPLFSIRRVTP